MRSERRHELEHNELADWTVKFIEKIKPYTNVIVGGTIAVVILAVGITLWVRHTRFESETAWSVYYVGMNEKSPEKLQDVVKEFPRSDAARWANITEGNLLLRKGCELLSVVWKTNGIYIEDKMGGLDQVEAAIKCYEAAQGSGDSMLDQQAALGLARAYEAKGDLEKAKAGYEKMQEKWKDGVYAVVVKQRLNSLSKDSTKEFYKRFEKFEPAPALPSATTDYKGTDVPDEPGKKPVEDGKVKTEGSEGSSSGEPKATTDKPEPSEAEKAKAEASKKVEKPEATTPAVEPKKEEPVKKEEPAKKEEPEKTE